MAKYDYMTLTVPGKKGVSICQRRIGTRDRYSVFATVADETIAEKVVDALNLLQGKIVELETPAMRLVTELREQLKEARQRSDTHRSEKLLAMDAARRGEAEHRQKVRELETQLASLQKTARETV